MASIKLPYHPFRILTPEDAPGDLHKISDPVAAVKSDLKRPPRLANAVFERRTAQEPSLAVVDAYGLRYLHQSCKKPLIPLSDKRWTRGALIIYFFMFYVLTSGGLWTA